MTTAESVKAKLQGLIATANAATGNADADLATAVNSLVAGFGQGGGGTTPFTRSAVSYFTPAADGIMTHDFDFGEIDFTPNFLLMCPVLDANIERLAWVYKLTYAFCQERKWLANISNGTPHAILCGVNYGGNTQPGCVCVIGEDGVIQFGTSDATYSYKNGVTYALYALRWEELNGEV